MCSTLTLLYSISGMENEPQGKSIAFVSEGSLMSHWLSKPPSGVRSEHVGSNITGCFDEKSKGNIPVYSITF